MASGGKRLDLQFGSFACSVQGFDDPVTPVQQVLQAMQHVLEESPELGTAGLNFDAEMIEQLIGEVGRRADLDESSIEIVPGLIIIHHGEVSRSAPVVKAAPTLVEEDEEETIILGGPKHEAPEQPDYINIFAPAQHAEEPAPEDDPFADMEEGDFAPTAAAEEEDDEPTPADLIAERLGGTDAGGPPRDIFAEGADEPAAQDSVFADTLGASARADARADVSADVSASSNVGASSRASRSSGPSDVNFFSSPLLPALRPRSSRSHDVEDVIPLSLFSSADTAERESTGPSPVSEPAEAAPDTEGYTAASLAAKAGAATVPDLIVSAAAWMLLIKGQTSFSRKDVLEVFDGMPGDHEKSLQSRIRGFGKAVRDRQLVQLDDGLFGLSRKELKRFQSAL